MSHVYLDVFRNWLRLRNVVEARFKKFAAMAPEVLSSPTKDRKFIHDFDHAELRNNLSPISSAKVHQLEAPSKKGLSEYDRGMTTLQNALTKAMKTCTAAVDKAKEHEVREQARLAKLEEAREKAEQRRARAFEKARQERTNEAGKQIVEQEGHGETGEDEEEEEEEDVQTWALVQRAGDMLRNPTNNVGLVLSFFALK